MQLLRLALLALLLVLQTNQVRAADDPLSEEQLKRKALQDLSAAKKQIKAKKYDYAVYFLKEALDADKKNADIYYNLGFAYRKMKKFDKSMAAYNKALKINPKHKGALDYQGELFLTLKKPAEAQKNWKKLQKLCPRGCPDFTKLQKAITSYNSGTYGGY
ncbi:MAG: tetratricopeptide repeat protein [Pseudomonadota bacterium]|nr:tetratricopeptide repeat protein [Pseudomonadota bacterium]